MKIELKLVAIYKYISKKEEIIGLDKMRSIKTTSFFNVVGYKFKNFVNGAFGSWFWEPYNKKLTLSLTFKFEKIESTFSRFSKRSSPRGE